MSDFDMTDARKKGGKARAEGMTAEERKAMAKAAAAKRWHGIDVQSLPMAKHGSADRPMRIGDVEIPCFVLEDGTRVITHTGMLGAVGLSSRSGSTGGSHRLLHFAAGQRLQPFIGAELLSRISQPKWFRLPGKGQPAHGYEATVLADICESVLAARKAGVLDPRQAHIADACEILMRGFAKVGIIALVDEATGYQQSRVGDELRKLLERYVQEDFRKWMRTFPDDFFQGVFRIHGWKYEPGNRNRPQCVGSFINKTIYDQMAPGMRLLLNEMNPINEKGRRARVHTQHLTENEGLRDLQRQITKVTTIMDVAGDDKDRFWEMFHRLHPPAAAN